MTDIDFTVCQQQRYVYYICLNQCWFNVGPAKYTVEQLYANICLYERHHDDQRLINSASLNEFEQLKL